MDDAPVVRGGEGVGELRPDLEQSLQRQATLGDEAVERLPLDELHRQEVDAFGLLDGEDADDARVVESGERLGLPLEALPPLRVRGHLGRKDLEGHVAPQLRVGGTVDLAHSPGADPGRDAVVGERLADHRETAGRAIWPSS